MTEKTDFKAWCQKKFDEADEDLGPAETFFMFDVLRGTYEGTMREMKDQIWDNRKLSESRKRYLQEGLQRLYLIYVYEVNL